MDTYTGETRTRAIALYGSTAGLGGAAENCAAEMTPGWQLNFDVDGKEYEVRSNNVGNIIRIP